MKLFYIGVNLVMLIVMFGGIYEADEIEFYKLIFTNLTGYFKFCSFFNEIFVYNYLPDNYVF